MTPEEVQVVIQLLDNIVLLLQSIFAVLSVVAGEIAAFAVVYFLIGHLKIGK